MSQEERHLLLSAIDERGLRIDQKAISSAFEDPAANGPIKAWVREHLSATTLLTKEELGFYEKFGLPAARNTAPISVSRPLSDADFEAAIASIADSTAAIEKQCQVLETQRRALSDFRSRHAPEDNSDQTQGEHRTKLTREKARLEFDISEVSESLNSQLRATGKQADVAVAGFSSGIDRMLEKDDRLLDGLQKLFPRIADTATTGNEARDVERLCQTLTILSAQDIRARIDNAYQAAVASNSSLANGDEASQAPTDKVRKQREAVAAELGELAADIDSLAAMAVDNRYRVPISRDLAAAKTDAEGEKVKWADYVVSTVTYLTARLDALSDHCQQLHAHQRAVQHVSAALEGVMAATVEKKVAPGHARSESAKAQAKGLKPLRLVQANLSESQDPAAAFLRHLDVRSADLTDLGRLADGLETSLRERQGQLSEQSRRIENAISYNLGHSLNNADVDVRDLLSGIYAYAPHDAVHLVDPQVLQELDGLEAKTETLSEQMRRLDLDELIREVRARQKHILSE